MPLRPRPGRRKENNNYGGASLRFIFFCFVIRENVWCGGKNDLSVVESFSFSTRSLAASTTKSTTRMRTRAIGRRDNPYRFQRLSMEMASPRPYFADLTPNNNNNNNNRNNNVNDESEKVSYNEEDDEEFVIFEEELRNNNLEQRIIERNKQRNQHNSINHDSAFEPISWGSSTSSSSFESKQSSITSTSTITSTSVVTSDEDTPDDDEQQMSDEQALALSLIKEGRNVFLTGVAGTGKSLVLKKALEHIKETFEDNEYVAVAPTGSTAVVLEGQTVHSFAGIGIPKIYTDFRKMKSNKKIKTRWENLKVLLLDEVSMVSGEFFDSLSTVVSDIRKDPRPFGGIQLIVCGDFLQLSPIAPRKWEVDQMVTGIREKEGLETVEEARNWLFLNRGFCFQSEAWKESSFEVVELKHVFRQSNRNFVNVLKDIRVGNVTPETVRYLKENCERPLPPNDFGVQPTILHSKNVNVAKENLVDLGKLSGDTVIFEAFDEVEREKGVGKWVEKDLSKNSFFKSCTAEKHLQLKIGAQVMLVKNLAQNSMLTNGSRGTIVGFRKVKRSSSLSLQGGSDTTNHLLPGVTKYPVVRFKNGLQMVITPQKFQSRILGMGTCTRTAIPLKLAWAITTHKAQGLTLDYVIADVGQVFAEAQLYVALSRVSDETGLELRNFSERRVKANPLALRFHNDPNQQYPFWWDLDGSKPKIMTEGSSSKPKPKNKKPPRNAAASQQQAYGKSSEILDKQILKERTVVELKQMLRERDLKVSGRKAELIERLMKKSARKLIVLRKI
jgi:ATP-dependent DNA helicase PIF1